MAAIVAAQRADACCGHAGPSSPPRSTPTHENPDYLPGVALPGSVARHGLARGACADADVVVLGVPSHGFRAVLDRGARRSSARGAAIVSLAKGIEQGNAAAHDRGRSREVLAGHDAGSHRRADRPEPRARGRGGPADRVGGRGARRSGRRRSCSSCSSSPTFRVYTNPDVVGCEMAGALKNVLAIGAGIADGLGYGDNTKAALITRGLAELARLGVALGGDPLTFAGLAGMGDLIATCSSPQSRNRHVGVELGKGRALDDIVSEMNMVAEGVKTTAAVLELAAARQVEMPLAAFVGRVLYEGARPADLVPELMLRKAKPELHGMR